MATRVRYSARQVSEHAEKQNKYAQVLMEAVERKRTRADLEDDAWLRRRAQNNYPAPVPTGD